MDNRIEELDFLLTLGMGSWSDRVRITLALVFKSNNLRKLEKLIPLLLDVRDRAPGPFYGMLGQTQ